MSDFTPEPISRQPSTVLGKIKKKSQMLADMHGQLADYYSRLQGFIYFGSLLTSCLILSLTFISDDFMAGTLHLMPDSFKWLKAIIAVLNFFAGLFLAIAKPSSLEAQNREAINHYTKALYAIRDLEERGNITDQDVKDIQEQYLDDSGLPRIPGTKFLKLKQRYLVKVEISRFLETNPHAWVWYLKARLWLRELSSGVIPESRLRQSQGRGLGG